MASASDYNAAIIDEFRATGGHPGGEWAGTTRQIPVFILTRQD